MTKTKNRKPLLDYLSVVRVPGIPDRPADGLIRPNVNPFQTYNKIRFQKVIQG